MKDKKYLIFFIAIITIYVVYEMQKPNPEDWTPTYHYRDRIPFGTFATHGLLKDLFDQQEAPSSFKTIYELVEQEEIEDNLLILSSGLMLDENDFSSLLTHVEKGHTVFLAAQDFSSRLEDSLHFETYLEQRLNPADFTQVINELAAETKTNVRFSLPNGNEETFVFPSLATVAYFSKVESDSITEMAWREDGKPVLLKYNGGQGDLYLSTMPLAFTNYFVLQEETSVFTSSLLSLFPKDEPLLHVEYYQLGKLESQSEIRALLSYPALRWAIYILLASMLIFILFESKRRQRIIAVIPPVKNATLEFVNTLGQLYHQQKNHKNLARKRILFWKDFVRSHYTLRTDKLDEPFKLELTRKSGTEKTTVFALVELVERVEANNMIEEGELLLMEKLMNEFYGIA
ncbi:DUF4350 domain-containing protein [Roseivirga sp.]|uniref:DUF4350 domain-containing protein n=1 Tax=Roseivirga sp. TaxID=1964215 RepID=UPI002B26EECC|nr:DUF4350 domain-containing protein [Roseivirga sp.]